MKNLNYLCCYLCKYRDWNKNKAEGSENNDLSPESMMQPKYPNVSTGFENICSVSFKASNHDKNKISEPHQKAPSSQHNKSASQLDEPILSQGEKDQKETKNLLDKKPVDEESINEDETPPQILAISTENPLDDAEKNLEKPMENPNIQNGLNNIINTENPLNNEKHKDTEEEKLLNQSPGLQNIGNSCYMNSIIQILASIPEFIESPVESPLLNPLIKLINTLIRSSNIIETEPLLTEFKNAISQQYSMFSGPSENDAKELFSIITNEADEANPASRLFTLVKKQVFTCDKGHQSSKSDENNFLTFSLAKQKDLQNFVSNIKAKTKFEFNNKLFCNECQHLRDTDMEIVSIDWPKILTFYLPPSHINLTVPENLEADEFKYKIFGVVCYYGNHFIAFVKDNSSGLWEEFNDSIVNWRDPDWSNLYLVFYKRIN